MRSIRCIVPLLASAFHVALAEVGELNQFAKVHRRNLLQSRLVTDIAAISDVSPAVHMNVRSGRTLKHMYPWYHTSRELQAEAMRLASDCGGAMSFWSVNDSGVSIDVARVRAPGSSPTNRVFIIFGEHSRELISPESGLHLLRVLCGKADGDGAGSAAAALQDSEFELVLNGNPRSRLAVEGGNFCERTNPDGVDLNRNWDVKWHQEGSSGDVNPGPRPFSEPETRIFRRLVMDYKPTTFLTVHSGTRGLYMPWAYDTQHLASRNQGSMLEILRGVDKEHCQCPYGAAGKEVGYSCPGTCLDWVYDHLQTPYSFAFEIYTNPGYDAELRSRWERKLHSGGLSLLRSGSHLGHPHFLDLFQDHVSDFVQVSSGAGWHDDPHVCFGLFNPDTQERFEATVKNWAAAYLEMAQLVVADMRRPHGAAAGLNLTR